MKKVLAIICTVLMIVCLASCSDAQPKGVIINGEKLDYKNVFGEYNDSSELLNVYFCLDENPDFGSDPANGIVVEIPFYMLTNTEYGLTSTNYVGTEGSDTLYIDMWCEGEDLCKFSSGVFKASYDDGVVSISFTGTAMDSTNIVINYNGPVLLEGSYSEWKSN